VEEEMPAIKAVNNSTMTMPANKKPSMEAKVNLKN
jgi:hypothetical protein